MPSRRLIVMAGGTGGHIFPGIAIAQYLMSHGWKILWLGTADRLEATLVPQHGIEIEFIRIQGLRGKGIKAFLTLCPKFISAVRKACKIIKLWHPNVVLGMGGYVSGPGCLAAWIYGIPIIIHEQNGIAGLTNRWIAKIAKITLQAFPGTFKNAVVVGNPIRDKLRTLPPPEVRFSCRQTLPLRILVLGGSQGSQILNFTIPQLAIIMGNKITIWHQVGKQALNIVMKYYQQVYHTKYRLNEFIEDIALAYSWADIVICRSGAMTVSEIAVVGLPAIFVPFKHNDRQQYWNALPFEKIGAAKILEQSKFTAQMVAEILKKLDRSTLLSMAVSARSLAISDATERIAAMICRSATTC
ncbi:MAG: undecaprenyldiphospho-muramoylpentapeptide beta-N-acetylglucosaminyltransferase [Candidatus Dasytiphilus stammeri]